MPATFQSPLTSNVNAISPHTTHTLSVTVNAGTNLCLVALVHLEAVSSVVSGVTFGGVALTLMTSATQNGAGSFARTEIWYLKNPTPSTANLVATMASSDHSALGCIVGIDVDNSGTPLRPVAKANTTGTSSTVTVTGVTSDDLVFDALTEDGTGHATVTGANQTEQYDLEVAAGTVTGVCDTQLGANGGVMSHTWTTSTDCAHIGTAFIGTTGAAANLVMAESFQAIPFF